MSGFFLTDICFLLSLGTDREKGGWGVVLFVSAFVGGEGVAFVCMCCFYVRCLQQSFLKSKMTVETCVCMCLSLHVSPQDEAGYGALMMI